MIYVPLPRSKVCLSVGLSIANKFDPHYILRGQLLLFHTLYLTNIFNLTYILTNTRECVIMYAS